MDGYQSTKKNKKRTENFSTSLKKELAALVRENPRIWDVTDPLHSRKDAIDQSWQTISKAIGRTVSECKSAWTSMMESSRYYSRVSRKGKSGDGGGEYLDEPICSNAVNWELAGDLEFLPTISQKRKTYQSFEEECSAIDWSISQPPELDSSEVQYDYAPAMKKRRRDNSGSELLEGVGDLLNSTQKLQEERAKMATKSDFAPALEYFDWMLNKLPLEVAEDAVEEITSMLSDKVKENRAKQSTKE